MGGVEDIFKKREDREARELEEGTAIPYGTSTRSFHKSPRLYLH